jgi:hypothetical protein
LGDPPGARTGDPREHPRGPPGSGLGDCLVLFGFHFGFHLKMICGRPRAATPMILGVRPKASPIIIFK